MADQERTPVKRTKYATAETMQIHQCCGLQPILPTILCYSTITWRGLTVSTEYFKNSLKNSGFSVL